MPHGVKPSRLLARLDAEIAAAKVPLGADCKRAERAACLARLGRVDDARREVEALKGRYSRQPHALVSIRVNLAEGLIAYFENVGVNTTDKLQRAYALSVAAEVEPLRALCAAWLAHWAYSTLDMAALARHVREALSHAQPDNLAARSRACLVAAQALHFAGRPDLAMVWYGRSRMCANDDGDDVTISALMHNMAWLNMLNLRQAVLTETGDVDAGKFALLHAESAANFGERTGDVSWQELTPLLRAQIHSLQRDPIQALELYEHHLAAADDRSRLRATLLADKAWCHADLGHGGEAARCAELAARCLSDDTQVDDRAATHSRLAQVFAALDDTPQHELHLGLARRAWDEHLAIQAHAVELLAGLDENGRDPAAAGSTAGPG